MSSGLESPPTPGAGREVPALVHLGAGALAVIAFLATGLMMRSQLRADPAVDLAVRYMRRADHVYLLLSGLLNLALGLVPAAGRRSRLQTIGSACLLAAPLLYVVAFLVEPRPASLWRPFTLLATLLAAAGVLLHVFPALWGRQR